MVLMVAIQLFQQLHLLVVVKVALTLRQVVLHIQEQMVVPVEEEQVKMLLLLKEQEILLPQVQLKVQMVDKEDVLVVIEPEVVAVALLGQEQQALLIELQVQEGLEQQRVFQDLQQLMLAVVAV